MGNGRNAPVACAFGIAVIGMALLTMTLPANSSSTSANDTSAPARKLHFSSIVIDTHDDTTQRLIYQHLDLGKRDAEGSIDIPRMREGGLGAIFFSIWMSGKITGPLAVKNSLIQIDAVREQVRAHPNDLALCTIADCIRRAHADGKIAVLMGMEGGHIIDDDLAVLRSYAELGVRYLTLTHMVNTNWADSSTDTPAHNGLTDFGKQVIHELNRDGVMVDISHVSDKTFYDALAASRAPLIASHSSCRAICNAPRNMTDEMIRALAASGGVIQINYHVGFLSQKFYDAARNSAELKQRSEEADKRCGDNQACQIIEEDRVMRAMVAEGKLPRISWEVIVDHIDHAVKLVGAEHVGLGSDFDGADMPHGMEDASDLPKITQELLRRGYTDSQIRAILGENTLRLMEQVERVSRAMQADEHAAR
jgi:membrane dipeptidase